MKLAAAFAAALFALPVPISGDNLDVGADPWSPKLRISGTEKQKPTVNGRSSTSGPARTGQARPTTNCSLTSAGLADCVAQFFTDAPAPARPALTPGRVARAVREVPMPRLRLAIQPGGRTLVNVPTILHTRPTTLRRTIDLLGHEVEVRATPVRYTWHHGDGTARTTRSPGKPYPAKTVTHRYRKSSPRLLARVDTTYTVRYRVDGGAWTGLGDTLTATGPSVGLRVDQRAPALIDR